MCSDLFRILGTSLPCSLLSGQVSIVLYTHLRPRASHPPIGFSRSSRSMWYFHHGFRNHSWSKVITQVVVSDDGSTSRKVKATSLTAG